MEFGAHLPLIQFDDERVSFTKLRAYTEHARQLGYTFLCANDHLVFSRPWLDGPTALASVIEASGDMTLATTVAIPVVRGPVPAAKTLAAIDILSGGRLVVGVGPGSSARDYAAVGVPFEERWKRLDEAVRVLRSLWDPNSEGFAGTYYSTDGIALEPYPAQAHGPPIWIGSWGSAAGLRRVARIGDGWLASAYNTTPEAFAQGLSRLSTELRSLGKGLKKPNGIATMWTYVTEDRAAADRILSSVLGPMVNRPVDELRAVLPIGPAEECAEKLSAYAAVGAQRVFIWPMTDDLRQLELFQERVAPLVRAPN